MSAIGMEQRKTPAGDLTVNSANKVRDIDPSGEISYLIVSSVPHVLLGVLSFRLHFVQVRIRLFQQ